jgi:hypothetical protein
MAKADTDVGIKGTAGNANHFPLGGVKTGQKLLFLGYFRCKHYSIAAGGPAAAGKSAFYRCRMAALVNQRVIVAELFPRLDVSHRIDIHAAVLVFERLAIGLAGMVDKARRVTFARAIDDASIRKTEEIRVPYWISCRGCPVQCAFP